MNLQCTYCGGSNIDYQDDSHSTKICKDCGNLWIDETHIETIENKTIVSKCKKNQIIKNTTYKTVELFIEPQKYDKTECWLVQCIKCNNRKTIELPLDISKIEKIKNCSCNKPIRNFNDLTNKEVGDYRILSYCGKKSNKSHNKYLECKMQNMW